MLLFRDQIQDSYTGSRSCQTLNPISQTRSRLVLSPQTVFSMFFSRSSERRTKLLALERGTAILLSKDGSTILDEGRRTRLRLFMLFSEDGERWTFFQALLNQEPGRVASERGTWAQRAGTALLLFRRTALLYSAFHDLFG